MITSCLKFPPTLENCNFLHRLLLTHNARDALIYKIKMWNNVRLFTTVKYLLKY